MGRVGSALDNAAAESFFSPWSRAALPPQFTSWDEAPHNHLAPPHPPTVLSSP